MMRATQKPGGRLGVGDDLLGGQAVRGVDGHAPEPGPLCMTESTREHVLLPFAQRASTASRSNTATAP